MSTVPHGAPEGAHDDLASEASQPIHDAADDLRRAGQRETLLPTGDEEDDDLPTEKPPSRAAADATAYAGSELEGLRQTLQPKELATASLAELLFYGLSDGGEGAEAILKAARDDLANVANLAAGTEGGSGDLVPVSALSGTLDGIVRRLDVAIALSERAAMKASRREARS